MLAVTRRRSVFPTSLATGTYDDPVAPETFVQDEPDASHRRHCRANVIGAVPDQVPFEPDSVCPTCAEPLTTGSPVLTGALGGGASSSAWAVGQVAAAIFAWPLAVKWKLSYVVRSDGLKTIP